MSSTIYEMNSFNENIFLLFMIDAKVMDSFMKANIDISRVDLNLFVVFDVIYREGNLTRASEALNLSQPAVSHALSRLRDRFDDPLFERSGKKMVPTPLAKAIVERVREGLGNLESTLSDGLIFDPGTAERTFTIAMRDVLEAKALPEIAKHLQRIAPHISIRSVQMSRRDIESALIRGTIDFAADVLIPVSKQVRHGLIGSEGLSVMMAKGHPLVAKLSSQDFNIKDYLQAKHIQVSSRASGLGIEDVALSRLGETREIGMRCQHYYAAAKVVEKTDWLLTLPTTYASALSDESHPNNPYVIFPLPFQAEPLEVHLYWHHKAEHDPAMIWCKQQIENLLMG
jgi:DNA-binding transcriptional LysR family regulator